MKTDQEIVEELAVYLNENTGIHGFEIPLVIKKLRTTLKAVREDEVRNAIKISDNQERGNETEFNEWRAFKGFRNALHDRLQTLTYNN